MNDKTVMRDDNIDKITSCLHPIGSDGPPNCLLCNQIQMKLEIENLGLII